MTTPDLIGTAEAARRLGLSEYGGPSLVARWIRDGRLPAIKVGNTWLIRPADLDRLERRGPGRPPRGASQDRVKRSW